MKTAGKAKNGAVPFVRPSYAQGNYAAEMEQAALMAEAKETMER